MTNPMQSLDPMGAPPPVTPHDSPSSPSGYASVTPHGIGPAPYDIQAPQAGLSGEFDAANAVAGAGVLYAQGPRQAATERLWTSPAGYHEQDIQSGYAGAMGGDPGWPADIGPADTYVMDTGTD